MDLNREKIDKLLDEYIDVPNYSYFHNYEKGISGAECYNELIDELIKLIIKN